MQFPVWEARRYIRRQARAGCKGAIEGRTEERNFVYVHLGARGHDKNLRLSERILRAGELSNRDGERATGGTYTSDPPGFSV